MWPKERKYDYSGSYMPSFANSQPSAVDGLKWRLWPIPQGSRTAHKYGNVSGIYVVITNLYRTPKFCGAADLWSALGMRSRLSALCLCRAALGQSSLMGRWVHSPNLCYNFILLSAMKWNDLLFGSNFQMIFLSEWRPHFRYDND